MPAFWLPWGFGPREDDLKVDPHKTRKVRAGAPFDPAQLLKEPRYSRPCEVRDGKVVPVEEPSPPIAPQRSSVGVRLSRSPVRPPVAQVGLRRRRIAP